MKRVVASGIGVLALSVATITISLNNNNDSANVIHVSSEIAKDYEGLRLHPYRDIAGFPTVGYGHLLSRDKTIPLAHFKSITKEQAESLLEADLEESFSHVFLLVQDSLSVNQYAALVDFVFNEGVGHFERSTMLRYLNEGLKDSIPSQLLRWEYADGHSVEELERRRLAEIDLWNKN